MVVTMTEQETDAAGRLHEQLSRTATGQRWERIFRVHEREIEALLTIHPDVREDVTSALIAIGRVCPVVDETEPPFTAAGEALEAARRVLDGLVRLGSFDLSRDARTLREELDDARARALLGRALA
ncbi:MAG: hypothetical protein U0Q15_07390 [Kineosporiaceae bacterium]